MSSKKDEADQILSMAAKIILNDIRATEFDCEWYPTTDTIQSTEKSLEWIPPKLQLFLQGICKNLLKQGSIGQAIVSAVRWLIDHLNKLGFCISMNEVTRDKQLVTEKDNYDSEFSKLARSFTQWSADNVDHNVRTIDGKGSLHGMGIVYSTTNKFSSSDSTNLPLVKCNKLMKLKI